MNYTVAQVASMFDKKPVEISAVVRKGGIKGLTVEESEDGVRYLLSEQAVDQLGAHFGTKPKEVKEAKEIRDSKRLITENNNRMPYCFSLPAIVRKQYESIITKLMKRPGRGQDGR